MTLYEIKQIYELGLSFNFVFLKWSEGETNVAERYLEVQGCDIREF